MSINLEKLYENACDALLVACRYEQGSDKDGDALYDSVVKDPDRFLKLSYYDNVLPSLEIWTEVREELLKSKGGTVYSTVKKMVKSIGDKRPSFNGCWYDSDGRQCFCDGYRGIRLKFPVDGFEEVPGMDLEKAMKIDGECVMLDVPTVGQVKACIAEQRGRTQKVYDFGDGLPQVNAEYLRDMVTIFPNAVAKSYGINAAIIFEDEIGDGILLPIHKTA